MNFTIVNNALDSLMFLGLVIFGSLIYVEHTDLFNTLTILSMIYVGIRRPDINTLTLIAILLVAEVPAIIMVTIPDQLDNLQIHSRLLVNNLVMLVLISFRHTILTRFGPKIISDNPNLVSTRQDILMSLMFALQVMWQFLQLVEHVIRHADQHGFGHIFGLWKPQLFYDYYKTGQFLFAICNLLILYFMTFEQSKRPMKVRKQSQRLN